jgi:hypothetical protein
MKAVVAVPPVLDFYFTPSRASALGASTVAGLLEKTGIETSLLNFPLSARKPSRLELPDELGHIKPFLIKGESGPVSFFSVYKRFGPAMSHCAEKIAEKNPNLLFISCFAWAYAGETISLADAVKKIRPGIIIVAGGAGVSVNPGFFEAAASIDWAICGEAEKVLPSFLSEKLNAAAAPASDPDIPEFQIRRTGHSERRNISYYSAILTRGCPKACRFCANYLVHGRKFRKTPPSTVKQEILLLPADENVHINFEDDNMLFAKDYFIDILRFIKERFPNAEFSAENGLDYTLLDKNLLDELIRLGFRSFNLSMASTSQDLLYRQDRPADSDRLAEILKVLGEKKIKSVTYFICGLEGETPETAVDNLIYLHSLPTLTGISLFYPVPGIPSGENDLNNYPPRLCAGSSAWPWTGSLTTLQLITAFRLSRLSNLIKTLEGRIASTAGEEQYRRLLDRIIDTGKLHTLKGGVIIKVPGMDTDMVTDFLNRS